MARPAEVYVAGLRDTLRAVRRAGDEVQREVRDDFRAGVAPTVEDIKGRFSALQKMPGKRTARTVRGSFSQSRIELRMGGRGGPAWGFELGTEFGAKDRVQTQTFVQRRRSGSVQVARDMNYGKVFGPWTGNQFRPQGRTSGRAFYPGIRDHYDELVDGVVHSVDVALDKVGRTGA